jgi:hypothetical protein
MARVTGVATIYTPEELPRSKSQEATLDLRASGIC